MVIASTLVTVLIVIGVVLLNVAVFLAFGAAQLAREPARRRGGGRAAGPWPRAVTRHRGRAAGRRGPYDVRRRGSAGPGERVASAARGARRTTAITVSSGWSLGRGRSVGHAGGGGLDFDFGADLNVTTPPLT